METCIFSQFQHHHEQLLQLFFPLMYIYWYSQLLHNRYKQDKGTHHFSMLFSKFPIFK